MATHTEHAAHGADHAHSPEEFKKHIRGYWVIFFALLVLTGLTVGVAEIGARQHWGTFATVAVALVVATTKGTLVCLYFMHLIDEKKVIYWTLLLVAAMTVPLFALPNFTEGETADHRIRYETHMRGTEPHHGAAEGAKGEHGTDGKTGGHETKTDATHEGGSGAGH